MSIQQGELDLTELRDSVAVVTGAGNNGIGWGICLHAARQLGMHVIAIDLHETLVTSAQARLRELVPEVQAFGIAADVTKPDSMGAARAQIEQLLPGKRIGAVFANAGVIFNRTILKSTADEWSTTLNVNVMGVINTIQAFVPLLEANAANAVFCATASIGGLVRGDGGGAAYQASKHAVVAICESLSFELARKSPQVRVHVLCPCIVASALGESSRTNATVRAGAIAEALATPHEPASFGSLAMSTDRHAQQVFDHIGAARFYMITDNVRPYVDHDFPFDGLGLVRERFNSLMELQLDNSDAFDTDGRRPPSAILKGPMFQELQRRR